MIYPKSSITKTWYQYDVNNVVLEKFSYDPADAVSPAAVCAGYDMEPTIKDSDNNDVANPNYGRLLPPDKEGDTVTVSTDEKLAKIFPHMVIKYYACRVDTVNSTSESTVYQYKTEEGTWVSDKGSAKVNEVYMWLDNMVLDGDGISVNDSEPKWAGVAFTCAIASHPDYESYKELFISEAQSDIIDAMMNGTSYDTARNSLPWYTRKAETEHPIVNGEMRELVETKVYDANDTTGSSLTEGLSKDDATLIAALTDKLNEQAKKCADELNESVVVANGMADSITYEFKKSFSDGSEDDETNSGQTPDPGTGNVPDPSGDPENGDDPDPTTGNVPDPSDDPENVADPDDGN